VIGWLRARWQRRHRHEWEIVMDMRAVEACLACGTERQIQDYQRLMSWQFRMMAGLLRRQREARRA